MKFLKSCVRRVALFVRETLPTNSTEKWGRNFRFNARNDLARVDDKQRVTQQDKKKQQLWKSIQSRRDRTTGNI